MYGSVWTVQFRVCAVDRPPHDEQDVAARVESCQVRSRTTGAVVREHCQRRGTASCARWQEGAQMPQALASWTDDGSQERAVSACLSAPNSRSAVTWSRRN